MVALLVLMNISIEKLTDENIQGAEILFIRSIGNLLLTLAIAGVGRQSIIPTQPKLQLGAFVCLGLSLLLILTSYQYITAGSVTTLQRLDIPMVALAGMAMGRFSSKQFILSALAFVFVAALLLLNSKTDEDPFGYFLILSGVVVIAINTLLQKSIAKKESLTTIMFVVSMSSMFWGGIRCWYTGTTFTNINPQILLAIFGLSVVNLGIFYLVTNLYRKHTPAFVRYPYLIAAFATMGAEMIVEHKVFSPLLLGGNLAILLTLTLLVKASEEKAKTNEVH